MVVLDVPGELRRWALAEDADMVETLSRIEPMRRSAKGLARATDCT